MGAVTLGRLGYYSLIAAGLLAAPAAALAAAQTCYDYSKVNTCSEMNGVATGSDFCGPMTFRDGGVVPGYGRVIYAVGTINSPSSKQDTNILDDSARGFENFLKTAGVKPGALVVFHSPGGSVVAGFAIGETIRKNSLRTMVGQPQTPDRSNPLTALLTAGPTKGVCASACTLAFLGGTRRTVLNGSLYGVHAAELATVPQSQTLADLYYQGEHTAALTSVYLEEMGIDPSWLYVAEECAAGYNHILFLTPAQLAQTKATTAFTTSWTLVDDHGVIALVGNNPHSSAIPGYGDDLILACLGTPRHMVMRVDYLPEAYNAGEPAASARSAPMAFTLLVSSYSLSGFKANSVAKNQPTRINFAISGAVPALSLANLHTVTTTIPVTAPVANLLNGSDTLQFAFQGRTSPVGQVNFDLTEGHQEIGDYMAACQ